MTHSASLSRVLVALVLSGFVITASAQSRYGVVKGDRVRVRGGPGDVHAILGELPAGLPVEILTTQADWVKVVVPGGVVAYVNAGSANRPFVAEEAEGRGKVLVSRLMIRGAPNTDFPPVGALEPGARVQLLEKNAGWFRALFDEGLETWIHSSFLGEPVAGSDSVAEFSERAAARRKEFLASSRLGTDTLRADAAEVVRRSNVDRAFERFRSEERKAPAERDRTTVEKDLREVAASAPEGSADRQQAERMLAALADWERLEKAFVELETRKREMEQKSRVELSRKITELRETVETRAQAEEAKAGKKSPYIATGWVRMPLPGERIVNKQGGYRLERGGHREFILESTRYDLSEYAAGNYLVGIVAAEGPFDRIGTSLPVLFVTKLEILAPRE